MAAPTIIKGSDHFFVTTYEGNGGGQKVGKFVPFTDNGTIDKSVIFNDGDSPQLSKTPSGAGNRRTFTFSVWLKRGELTGAEQYILSASNSASSTKYDFIYFDTDNCIRIQHHNGSSVEGQLKTNRTFEDCTKWYHLVYRCDTTQSTATDRMRLYIDGDEVTSFSIDTNPSQNYDTDVNDATLQSLGKPGWHDGVYFDGYMAEVNLVDGTSYGPDTFGVTDTSTGRWIPKSLGSITYGTNGYRLTFANSAGQTIGDDTSGNGNDYTVTNIATTDLTTDSPTQNFATGFHNQSDNGTITRSEGNLKAVQGNNTSKFGSMRSTLILDPDDPNLYYCEYKVDNESGGNGSVVGFSDIRADGKKADSSDLRMDIGTNYMFACDTYVINERDGNDAGTGNDSSLNPSFTTNDVMGLAFQAGKIWIAKNNTWSNSGNPGAGTGFLVELPKNSKYRFYAGQYGSASGNSGTFNFGQKSFTYTAPTGAKNLQQDNLLDEGVKPDLVWIKNRDATDSHQWYDSTRGPLKDMHTDSTAQESTTTDGLQKFLQGGCAIEDDVSINTVAESYVAWNWVANGGTTSANTDGSGATLASTIQANQDAGFSIVQVTAPSSPSGTYKIAHGLGAAPHWIIGKNLENSGGYNWTVFHQFKSSAPQNEFMRFNTSDAYADNDTVWGDTAPTSSVFTAGVGSPLLANEKTIFYCWAPIEGYSNFGLYIGSNNANGPFIYTGFKPALVIIKSTSGHTGYPWAIYDSTRSPTNPVSLMLESNRNVAENNLDRIDFLANGFKLRQSYSYSNASVAYTYMAFAEHPFVGSGTNPVTAR